MEFFKPALTVTFPALSAGPWSRRLGIPVLLLAGILLSTPVSGLPASATGTPANGTAAAGTFDVATVEDLAVFFAVESVRKMRIPLAYRALTLVYGKIDKKEMVEEIQKSPPKADALGVVYPFGDKNKLSFVFDADTRTLSCWERVVKKYGSTGMLGLTGPEMAAALNASTSRTRDRGGADFAYDPIRDALSLYREYLHPPADRGSFYKDIDRLVTAVAKLEKKRYLEFAITASEKGRPPASAAAARDGFGATLVLRHFSVEPSESEHYVKRYLKTWDRQPGGLTPNLVSDRELLIDQILHAYIHFTGARNGARGIAAVDATFRLIAPDGTQVFEKSGVPMWRERAQPPDHLQLGVKDLSFSLDAQEPTGSYQLEADVCDAATTRCVELVHPFVLRSR